jgi:hypothetical protein
LGPEEDDPTSNPQRRERTSEFAPKLSPVASRSLPKSGSKPFGESSSCSTRPLLREVTSLENKLLETHEGVMLPKDGLKIHCEENIKLENVTRFQQIKAAVSKIQHNHVNHKNNILLIINNLFCKRCQTFIGV